MSPRTGRPTDDPKTLSTRVRLSEEDIERLEFCANKTGLTKAEIIRRGIEEAYKQMQYKYEYRRVGDVEQSEKSKIKFDTIEELIQSNQKEFEWIKVETLELKPYIDNTMLLVGEWKDGTVAPVGYVKTL